MKSISAQIAAAILLATALAGCASDETTNSDTFSQLEVNLIIGNTDVTAVSFDLVCDGGFTLSGQFNVNDEQDPPIWSVIMDVPVGDCSLTLTAFNEQGEPLCIGGPEDFTVVEGETVKVNIVLACEGDGSDPLGNVEVDATFEEVEANNCPRLHLLNAVPDEVPAEGTAVSVLVSDKDGDVLTTALTATGGSFVDPASQSTTYTCDDATGTQTMFVTVSDGETACDKSTSFDVTCPGDNNLCEGKTCDAGNQCVAAECNEATGDCETSNVGSGVGCELGELTTNGGFELGNLEGWTLFCDGPNNGSCEATDAEANGGSYSGRVVTAGAPANPLIKQANVGVGLVEANSEITISFDVKGSAGPGGVVFAELISEFSGGGGTLENLATFEPPSEWTNRTFTTNTGGDVGGGVTLQLVAVCGAVQDCIVDVYFDNVSIVYGSGAGTCDGQGTCVPSVECSVPGDCPDDGNECTDAVCDAGTCGTSNNTNVCDGENGTCSAGVCVPNAECSAPGDCPDDGNECTDPVCDAGACGASNNTNVCDGGNGTCSAGVCEPNAEVVYSQNFESLDQASTTALGDVGFLVFGNVYEGMTDTVIAFYGTFPAPNNPASAAFSLIAAGEGGAAQGAQQVVIISDYNNQTEMLAGNNVEALTFQERTIVAGDVGKTLTFSFQAKLGDIGGSSEAYAFIKTLAPPTFDQTNLVTVDTTSTPATWVTYTLSLDIIAPLVGQILQFGFSATATNNEPSGVFYDNLVVTTAPTP